eukprot:NODE_525_length_7233_cov_0.321374.p1 type:complete len:439 gc:universal NODE_525_length_7233_cov_0.321374:6794-5478(-)
MVNTLNRENSVRDDKMLRKTLSRVTAMFEDEFLLSDEQSKKTNIFLNFVYAICIGLVFVFPFLIAISFQSTPNLFDYSTNIKKNSADFIFNDNGTLYLSQEMQRWSVLLCSIWGCFVLLYSICTIIPVVIFEILKLSDSNAGKLAQTLTYIKGLKRSTVRLGSAVCCSVVCDALWGISGPFRRTAGDNPLPRYIFVVSGIFKAFIFYMALLFLKKIFIITLYSRLRERTYKDRIIFSKKAVDVIEHLRNTLVKKIHAEKFISEARLHLKETKEDIEFHNYDNLFDKLAVDHAKEIYLGLAKGRHLSVNEFKPHFKEEALAVEAFQIFAGDEKHELTGKEFKEAIIQIYRERRRLNDNIRDMNGSISKLESIFNFFSFIFAIVFLAAYFDDTFLRASLPIFSSMLALSFLFAESAKELFTNCVFLFNIHPYDSVIIMLI